MPQMSESTDLTVNSVGRRLEPDDGLGKSKNQGGVKEHFLVAISSSFDLGYVKISLSPQAEVFEGGIKGELHPDVAWGPVGVWLTVRLAWRAGKRGAGDGRGGPRGVRHAPGFSE